MSIRMADSSVDRERRTPIELWIAGAAAILLGVLCLLVLRPFISASLSALIATLFLTAVIVVPVAILGATLADNVSSLIAAGQKLIQQGPPSPPDWVASVPLIGSHV